MFKHAILLLTLCGCLSLSNRLLGCYADFSYNNACAGDTIFFNSFYEFGGAYSWNFGDTNPDAINIGYGNTAYHVYTQSGTYYTTLFVNIGAEWAYQTQIIEVTENCFNAQFNTDCQYYNPNTYVYFNNQSIGNITQYQWDFGDPATAADTSSEQHPYYIYTSPGTYTATLTITSGTNTATTSQTITISTNSADYCIGASFGFNYYSTDCLQDTTQFYTSYWGNITAYYWNFGDPASGIFNFSTQPNPSHLYTAQGTYLVTLIIANAYTADTLYNPIFVGDCDVWPGDFNNDGQVTLQDLFPIGLYYNAAGPARPDATVNWTGQAAPDWNDFASYMYLQKLVNGKHADGNGDGILNELDINLITQHYGQSHNSQNNRQAYLGNIPPDAPQYQFNLPTCCLFDETGTLHLGITLSETGNYYGGSFTIHYNPDVVDANSVQFISDTPNTLMLQHNNTNGTLECAFVRTDKTNTLFDGNIGQFSCNTKSGIPFGSPILLSISDATLISNGVAQWQTNQQVYMPVQQNPDVIQITYTATPQPAQDTQLSIYPTITQTGAIQLYISQPGQQNLSINVCNTAGQTVYSTTATTFSGSLDTTLPLQNLPNGIYFINISTNTQTQTKKIIIAR